jgi:hypothetical protein
MASLATSGAQLMLKLIIILLCSYEHLLSSRKGASCASSPVIPEEKGLRKRPIAHRWRGDGGQRGAALRKGIAESEGMAIGLRNIQAGTGTYDANALYDDKADA